MKLYDPQQLLQKSPLALASSLVTASTVSPISNYLIAFVWEVVFQSNKFYIVSCPVKFRSFIVRQLFLSKININQKKCKWNAVMWLVPIFLDSPFFAVWPTKPPHLRVAGMSLDSDKMATLNISPVPNEFVSRITPSHKSIRSLVEGRN